MKDDNVIGKKLLIFFLLPLEMQNGKIRGRTRLFWLEAQIASWLQASPLIVCVGYMPYLDLVMLTFSSTTFDCCQQLFQGQVPSKAIEIQL